MLLNGATGTIQARDGQLERLEEFTNRVTNGEFHRATDETIPSACIDGRCGGTLRPNTAGGTNSLVVAEDLTNAVSVGYVETFHHIIAKLKSANLPLGGHVDEYQNDIKSGCGACDRLSEVYQRIITSSKSVRSLTEAIGVAVDDSLHERMLANAAARRDFPTGAQLKNELAKDSATIDHLRGEHNEVVAVINKQVGTTLNRDALEAEFGPDYEAFNIDVWAFENAAAVIADDTNNTHAMVAAMSYYNIATALVLCGPQMRVIVLG